MPDYVKVDASGRIASEDEPGRRRLASLAGRYYLPPTAPDFLLLLRAPPSGGKGPVPRVVLGGDLSGFPLAEMIGFIHQSRKTGVLRALTPSGERAIVLKNGEVRGAVSDDPGDRLGNIAVRMGLIDQATLDQALSDVSPSAQLGRILVERGLLKAHDLWKCLQYQVAEIFHSMVLSHEGSFVFVEQAVEDRGAALAVNTQGLLMDSIRRIDEMGEFKKRLPSDKAYLVPARQPGPELEAEERRVFEQCTGARTLSEVRKLVRLSEFEAHKIIYHLVEGGYISASQTADTGAGQRRVVGLEEVAKVFNDVFREVRNAVAHQGLATEFIAAANAAIPSQSEPVRKLLEGHGLNHDGTMEAAKLVENARAAGLDPRAAHAALSELMFFLLFQAGELLDPKTDEQLAQKVKVLLAQFEEAG